MVWKLFRIWWKFLSKWGILFRICCAIIVKFIRYKHKYIPFSNRLGWSFQIPERTLCHGASRLRICLFGHEFYNIDETTYKSETFPEICFISMKQTKTLWCFVLVMSITRYRFDTVTTFVYVIRWRDRRNVRRIRHCHIQQTIILFTRDHGEPTLTGRGALMYVKCRLHWSISGQGTSVRGSVRARVRSRVASVIRGPITSKPLRLHGAEMTNKKHNDK